MTAGARRTDTAYFVAVLVILVISLGWVSTKNRGSSSRQPAESQATPADPTVTSRPDAQRWGGELVFLRDNALIGRTDAGSERTIYAPPAGYSIERSTQPASGSLFIQLAGKDQTQVIGVTLADGTMSKSSAPDLTTALPRPIGTSFALVTTSNAERDFGSTVSLVDGKTTTKLFQSSTAVSAFSWRADGEVLALANQTELVLVTVSAGDTQRVILPGPVHSLNWRGADLILGTTVGPYVLIGGARVSMKLDLDPSVTVGLTALDAERYVWRTENGAVLSQVVGAQPMALDFSVDQLIGLAQ